MYQRVSVNYFFSGCFQVKQGMAQEKYKNPNKTKTTKK